MRFTYFLFFSFIFNSGLSFGQLPSNVEKLEGAWRYKEGSGYEVWEIHDDKLIGIAFRITKAGDTSKVEDIVLDKINDWLALNLTTYTVVDDSLVATQRSFVGVKLKM